MYVHVSGFWDICVLRILGTQRSARATTSADIIDIYIRIYTTRIHIHVYASYIYIYIYMCVCFNMYMYVCIYLWLLRHFYGANTMPCTLSNAHNSKSTNIPKARDMYMRVHTHIYILKMYTLTHGKERKCCPSAHVWCIHIHIQHIYIHTYIYECASIPPKNGPIALLLTTNGLMCSKYVSQKRNEAIDNCQSYKILINLIYCKSQSPYIRLQYM